MRRLLWLFVLRADEGKLFFVEQGIESLFLHASTVLNRMIDTYRRPAILVAIG